MQRTSETEAPNSRSAAIVTAHRTILCGRPISPGFGAGTAFFYHVGVANEPDIRTVPVTEVDFELSRLEDALRRSFYELETVQKRVQREIGEAESRILGVHLGLMQDPTFLNNLKKRIFADLLSSEGAVIRETGKMTQMLCDVENEYFRERVLDIHDIRARLLRHLGHGGAFCLENVPPGTVVVARELLPSDTLNMDRGHVSALLLERGGPTSHAAILARSMGIPAVGSLKNVFNTVPDGTAVLVDGEHGEVYVNPGHAETRRYTLHMRAYEKAISDVTATDGEGCATRDGCDVQLLANIGRPGELHQVGAHHLSGIGLLRTEYQLLTSDSPPSRSSQYAYYSEVLQALPDHPVTIRTLDLGGDKHPRFQLDIDHDEGAGLRGLHLSLLETNLFRDQVAAILDAAGERRDVGVLLPMVISAEDIFRALDTIGQIAKTLGRPKPPVGAMLEVPSAIFEAEEILDAVDFATIGTNDLVQYMLASERRTAEMLGEDAVLQPAVLRAIARVVRLANERQKPICVCGEAAGNPAVACLLVGLGVRQLSMSPVRAALVRNALRKQRLTELESIALTALQSVSREKIVALLQNLPR